MDFTRDVLRWTILIGGPAFAAGFFGPIILAPDANQGPLLGIFITGPIGVAVGTVVGLVVATRKRRATGRCTGSLGPPCSRETRSGFPRTTSW